VHFRVPELRVFFGPVNLAISDRSCLGLADFTQSPHTIKDKENCDQEDRANGWFRANSEGEVE
jgi:hypothetical protein|tara:strand:- start:465 stop:653 length:189 start_codon:yes stop_codon:yes gene_type:complete